MMTSSAFDNLGPIMVGPSSSHTAGALRIASVARSFAPGLPEHVTFTLYNSFSRTYRGHGTDRALVAGLLGLATDDERVKRNSWEFMKWWVSAEAQVRFGREIESILGSSARYATANRDALSQLAWSADQLKVLQEQMASTVGFREIAGGYSTTRHITNAIRRVIIAKEDTRETLMTYAKTINDEIRVKRREFNLPLD